MPVHMSPDNWRSSLENQYDEAVLWVFEQFKIIDFRGVMVIYMRKVMEEK